jgi:hypothetical protein
MPPSNLDRHIGLSILDVFQSLVDEQDKATAYSLVLHASPPANRIAHRAHARFTAEKSDVPTDAHAYEECMRIHQEEPPRALRTLCADVCRSLVSCKHF